MAANPQWYDATVEASVNAVAALCNGGTIQVFTGSQPALDGSLTGTHLVSATFANPAFANATASAGTVTATAHAITDGTIANTGTAGYVAVLESDGVTVIMTGSVGTSSADLVVNTTSFVAGADFAVTAATISEIQT